MMVIARGSSLACVTALMQLMGKHTQCKEGSLDPKVAYNTNVVHMVHHGSTQLLVHSVTD